MLEASTKSNSTSEYMELREFMAVIWRHKWLLVLITSLAVIGGFVISRLITPIYEASTTLLINQAPVPQTSDYNALLVSERLARTYAQMLTNRPVLEETISRLDLRMDIGDLERAIDVQLIRDTELIELRVEGDRPVLAAVLANTLVAVFAEQNDARQASRFAASKASLGARLDRISEQIQANGAATAELGALLSETQRIELNRLQTELAQLQGSYTETLQIYEQMLISEALTSSNIVQVESAEAPEEPVRPRILLNTLVAGLAGGMLALAIAFMIEHLDDSIKTPQDVARITRLPTIGYVADDNKLTVSGIRERLMISAPNSQLAESFRSLRTNIELAGNQGTPRSILVASPGPGDGSTTIATQLAISMAQGGKRVVLLDANLRRPGLHGFFGIKNELGLADMLIDDLVPQVVAKELIHWRLKIITSGKKAENPGELMASIEMLKVLSRLREQTDVAIFDGPPFLVAESFILASKLESVLIVMRSGKTAEGVAGSVVEQLKRAHPNLIGVVLNRVPQREAYGYDVRIGDLAKGKAGPDLGPVDLRPRRKKQSPLMREKETGPKA